MTLRLPRGPSFGYITCAYLTFTCGPLFLSSFRIPQSYPVQLMPPRAAPSDGGPGRGGRGGRGGERGRGRGGGERGRGRGGGERGGGRGGSERGRGRGGSDRGNGRGRGNGFGRGRGDGGGPRGGADRGGPRGGGGRGRGRGRGAYVEPGGAIVGAGGHPLPVMPTLSSGRTGPLPVDHIQAIGVKRRQYGNAGELIKLRSNHVEVKLDQGTVYHYDGMYLLYSCDDK